MCLLLKVCVFTACASVIMIFVQIISVNAIEIIHSRSKRNLVYQSAAVLQLTFGVQAPVMLPNRTIAVALCLQANFFLPLNITQLNPYYALTVLGDAARAVVEEAVENAEEQAEALEETQQQENKATEQPPISSTEGERRRRDVDDDGEGEPELADVYAQLEGTLGRACVLRAVCEAAAQPLVPTNHQGEPPGLMEELLHLLLTPSEAPEGVPESYLRAERRGRLAGDCEMAFSACRTSPLDLVSHSVFW